MRVGFVEVESWLEERSRGGFGENGFRMNESGGGGSKPIEITGNGKIYV